MASLGLYCGDGLVAFCLLVLNCVCFGAIDVG
jgi:hypothetical protein